MALFDVFYAQQIAAAAGRLEHSATGARDRAGLLAAACANCHWDGAGARAFRHRAHETVSRLRRAAVELDAAAAALRRHASRVADELAREQAERAAADERVRGELLDGLIGLRDLVRHAR